MVCKDTLRIKHLPKELSDAQKEDFAKHFGAIKVKVITSKIKEKSVVYAKFENAEIAKNILFRLHQISVLNSRLCVEYAETDVLQGKPQLKKIQESDISGKKFFKTFINKVNAFNDSVGFHQPPPSHLKYNYPKANRATINNIAHALATIPRFYTQVLHLMNKMNLPPPFAVPEPPVRTITPGRQPVAPTVTTQPLQTPQSQLEKRESSDESELESDNESKPKEIIPEKRKLPQKKIVKRPKFIKPTETPTVTPSKPHQKPSEVFEKVETVQRKKIEVKPPETLERKVEQIEATTSINLEKTTSEEVKEKSPENPETPKEKFISSEELLTNQIQSKDLGVLPIFKNYHPGAATNRLYIKNIAKTVVAEDLEYIYGRYKIVGENKDSEYNIRLMTEGRMKGQAFVTLDSIELAQKAVKETNAYILKDKPLVVVFARSAAQKK